MPSVHLSGVSGQTAEEEREGLGVLVVGTALKHFHCLG